MWVYDKVIRQTIDLAGKYHVWVSFVNGIEKQVAGFKFQASPTPEQIAGVVSVKAAALNRPHLPPHKTTSQLVEEMAEKDLTISQLKELRKQIDSVVAGPGTAPQKLQAIRDLLNASPTEVI
jgi:hypothetical protein